jgi:hypothetical protein
LRHRLCHASEQELLQAPPSLGAKHDAIRPPFRRGIENARFRLAFDHARMDLLKSRGTERLNGMIHDPLSFSMALLYTRLLFKERGVFDDMNEEDLGPLGPYLRREDLSGCVGKVRTVDRQQYFHLDPLAAAPLNEPKSCARDCIALAAKRQTLRNCA